MVDEQILGSHLRVIAVALRGSLPVIHAVVKQQLELGSAALRCYPILISPVAAECAKSRGTWSPGYNVTWQLLGGYLTDFQPPLAGHAHIHTASYSSSATRH